MPMVKNILITGAGSFVGTAVQNYLLQWPEKYVVTTIGTKSGKWETYDFSKFDTIFHVAGLAHSDIGNVDEATKSLYYAVNTELAINVAKKAKIEGVKQFIFMSSAIIYGSSSPIGKSKIITKETPYNPANFYGDSKVQAEKGILPLSDTHFKVVILRCPMIYGKGGKGNFPILEKLALKLPVFPKIKNERSMLYIENLAEFVRLMIENEESGIFWPCNKEWSNTSELVKLIAVCHNRKVLLIPHLGLALKILSYLTDYVDKAFGNLAYEKSLGNYKSEYRIYSLEQSIEKTEE